MVIKVPHLKKVLVKVKVFWVVMPCSFVVGHQRFGGPCCFHPEDGGRMALRNVDILP